MITNWFIAERFPSLVGTGFDDAASANAAYLALNQTPGLETARVTLVEPHDSSLARKLEPVGGDHAQTILRARLTLGAAGLALGLVLAYMMLAAGVQMFTTSPTLAVVTFAGFSLIFGLMLGGLVGLSPEHNTLIGKARDYSSSGRWFVVVHTRNQNQCERARLVLDSFTEPEEQALQTI